MDDHGADLGEAMKKPRWVLLEKTTPSGKALYGCSRCGIESPCPDKWHFHRTYCLRRHPEPRPDRDRAQAFLVEDEDFIEALAGLIESVREEAQTKAREYGEDWWRRACLKWLAYELGRVSCTHVLTKDEEASLQEEFGGTPSMIMASARRTFKARSSGA